MARGAIAKSDVENRIIAAFGKDYAGTFDKKIYLWGNENGEKVQICLTLTCPKTPVGGDNMGNGMNFETMPTEASDFKPAEITKEETENVRKLLAELGL